MMQNLRDKIKGITAGILVGILIIPLALFGVESLFVSGSQNEHVAEVNGESISQLELDRAIGIQKQQWAQRFGDNFDPNMIDDAMLREPVLTGLIQRELAIQAARDSGMRIPDAVIDQVILGVPEFQRDGQFDQDLFVARLRNLGFTPLSYREYLRGEMLIMLQGGGYASSNFVTTVELERAVALSRQTRDFTYLTLSVDDALDQVSVSDAEIEAYYQENPSQFISPEKVAINYLELKLSDYIDQVVISEEELRQQYQQEVDSFRGNLRRHVAHILVEEDEAKLAQAQERLAAGEDFADVAKELSDDLGSKKAGGDLGWTTGDSFPESFEAAVAALEVGQVSEPVATDSGWHLIKLLETDETEPPTFAQAKPRIERQLKRARAEERYIEDLETLKDIAFSAADLQEPAEALGLPLQQTEPFAQGQGVGIAARAPVNEAAFSEEVKTDGHNSPVIELSNEHAVVVHVREYLPVRSKPLADVRDDIRNTLEMEKAAQRLAERAQSLQQAVADGTRLSELAEAEGLTLTRLENVRRNSEDAPQALVDAVFKMGQPEGSDPRLDHFPLPGGDHALVALEAVQAGQLTAMGVNEQRSIAANLANYFGQTDYVSFQEAQLAQAEVERFQDDTDAPEAAEAP